MIKAATLFAALIGSIPAQAQEMGNRLNLVCAGNGTATGTETTQVFGSNSDGESTTATATRQTSASFEGQVQLWIEGGIGKARLPQAIVPPIHGGENGWFDIKDVRLSDTEITATALVNFVNHPKIVLDRLSGTIAISGKEGRFNGVCQKFDPANAHRAF